MSSESIKAVTASLPLDRASSTQQRRVSVDQQKDKKVAETAQQRESEAPSLEQAAAKAEDKPGYDEVRAQFAESLEKIQQSGYLRELAFDYEIGDDGDVLVKVLDAQTEEVIRQVPPEAQRQFAEKLDELAGLLFDQQG